MPAVKLGETSSAVQDSWFPKKVPTVEKDRNYRLIKIGPNRKTLQRRIHLSLLRGGHLHWRLLLLHLLLSRLLLRRLLLLKVSLCLRLLMTGHTLHVHGGRRALVVHDGDGFGEKVWDFGAARPPSALSVALALSEYDVVCAPVPTGSIVPLVVRGLLKAH